MKRKAVPAKTEAQRRADYQFVFGSAEGERVLADLSRWTRENGQTFVPGGPDAARWSDFLSGRRDVMLYISTQLGEPQHGRTADDRTDAAGNDATGASPE